jgi:hypothetical protein
MPDQFWQVIREEAFEQELEFLLPDAREADEFVEGAEFMLARDPRAGDLAANSGAGDLEIWLMPMAPIRGQQVSIYYSFDDENVYFLSIQISYPRIPPPMRP